MRPLQSLLILLIVLLPAGPFATTFPVTKTADTDDGTCDPDCSLREAIGAANTNPGPDDVTVPAGTYLLSLGQLTVRDDVVIAGAGQASTTIDGNRSDRVFGIQSGKAVTISNVVIQHGFVGYDDGGGIVNRGTLTLTDSTVRNNTASHHFYTIGQGGGIWNLGTLALTNSTVSDNFAGDGGGGILNDGTLTLTDSTVSGNTAVNDYFHGDGGGILNDGDLTLSNSTVSGNVAGGYFPYLIYYGRGGGVFNAGTATITNSTVSENSAYQGAGIYGSGTGTILTSTIVADNNSANCNGGVGSSGYNLTDDTSCGFTEPTDIIVADAMLGPLQDNGGPTETHDLLDGSPAIDASSMDCPPPDTDQRGAARPQGAACDIGAVEYLPEPRGALALIAGAGFLGLLYRRRARGLRRASRC